MLRLINGECLEEMKSIPDGSVDMVLADPPYGTTACGWDSIIPLEPMWKQLKRVIKSNGAIVMTASQPFTTTLISSNRKMFKYEWIWQKSRPSGHIHAKNKPLKYHENIVVFSSGTTVHVGQSDLRMVYNPQGLVEVNRKSYRPSRGTTGTIGYGPRKSHRQTLISPHENYPKSILKVPSKHNANQIHPTQKPVALMEYLIKTYTNENDTVLDFCMGSGTTGVACVNLNRSFIGIELGEFYFDDAAIRIDPTYKNPKDKKIDDMLDKFF